MRTHYLPPLLLWCVLLLLVMKPSWSCPRSSVVLLTPTKEWHGGPLFHLRQKLIQQVPGGWVRTMLESNMWCESAQLLCSSVTAATKSTFHDVWAETTLSRFILHSLPPRVGWECGSEAMGRVSGRHGHYSEWPWTSLWTIYSRQNPLFKLCLGLEWCQP